MTEDELREARYALRRTSQISRPLLDELVRVTRTVVADLALPDSSSPYGRWDHTIVDDLVADWLADRLLQNGRLLAMLDMAYTPSAFRSLAGDNLYQHVLSNRLRSQSQNIWKRLADMLERETDTFAVAQTAAKRADRFYTLVAEPSTELFSSSDRELRDAALAVGDLELLLWSSTAARLSPLIATVELRRFVVSVMSTIGRALKPTHLMTALYVRLNLAPDTEIPLSDALVAVDSPAVDDEVVFDEVARGVYDRMTSRQKRVLAAIGDGEQAKVTAQRLGVSAPTVANDRRHIAGLIGDVADDDDERRRILDRVMGITHEDRGGWNAQ